MKEIQNISSG